MEGTGAYTIVDGHKVTLNARDFVITPNGTWHEHGVDAAGTPCIWQDGLDIPLVNALEANFFAVHSDLHQPVGYPVDDVHGTWGSPGLRPATGEWSKGYSPLLKYEWEPTYEALQRFAAVNDGSPFDGVMLNYVNPVTGGPVMQTIGASMQMLRPGERTRAHRHTGSFVYQVARGRGFSIINGKRFDWSERDIFVVPSWAWHEHGNSADGDDACLFAFNDLPVMQALGLYREQAYGDNNGRQPLEPDVPRNAALPKKVGSRRSSANPDVYLGRRRRRRRKGILIAPTLIAFGLGVGLLAASKGLTVAEIALMSAWVYAGGAQMATLQVWAEPLPLLALVLTVLAMNARYILLSASLRPPFGTLPFWQIYPGLAIFGDGNWMLTMREIASSAGRTRASCSAAAW